MLSLTHLHSLSPSVSCGHNKDCSLPFLSLSHLHLMLLPAQEMLLLQLIVFVVKRIIVTCYYCQQRKLELKLLLHSIFQCVEAEEGVRPLAQRVFSWQMCNN